MLCKIKRTNKNQNNYDITFKGMSRGTIMALKNALETHVSLGSTCSGDVLEDLLIGIRSSGDDELIMSIIEVSKLAPSMPPGPPE